MIQNSSQNTILKFLWSVIKPYKWWYLLMMQAPIVNSFYKVFSMLAVARVVDVFTAKEILQYSSFFYPITLFVGAILVMELGWRLSHFAWMKTQPFVRSDIVVKSYDYIQNHAFEFFLNSHSGSIVSKIKGILAGYNNFWFGIHHRLSVPLLEIFIAVIALAFVNLQLFFFIVLWCLVFFPVMLRMSFKVSKLATKTTDSQHQSMGLVADNITNIFSLFSFASKKQELNKIKDFLYNDTAKKDYTWIKYELKMAFVGIAFYVSMLVALFIFMIHLRKIEAITTGDFVFVMTITFFVVDNIWKLVSEVGEFASKMGDFKSSFAILQIDNNAFDAKNSKVLAVKNGEIIFDNIDFGYSKNNLIFNNLSIKIKSGQKVGLVGYSGAGKSTLISLLLKNFKINSGDILIGPKYLRCFL